MHFSVRVAAAATILLGSSLVATSAPGWALAPDKPVVITPAILQEIKDVRDAAHMPATQESTPSAQPNAAVPPTTAPLADAEPAARDFATLAEAVAAQPMPAEMSDDLRCLAGAIYYEAKGEPLAGQLAVAKVIINRTQSGRFPRSICSVVTQRGQFAFVRGGAVRSPGLNVAAYRTAVAVGQLALADGWDSPAADALYFHARSVAPNWARARVAAIGNHIFYR